jgi:hypothetical protein
LARKKKVQIVNGKDYPIVAKRRKITITTTRGN